MRPKMNTSVLPTDWKERVLELYSEGASDVEIRCYLSDIRLDSNESFSYNLFDRLLKEDIEFCETIKKGRQLCQLWWEKKGRKSLNDNTFSPTLWYMNMKNRFGWCDKQEVVNHITGFEIVINKKNASTGED